MRKLLGFGLIMLLILIGCSKQQNTDKDQTKAVNSKPGWILAESDDDLLPGVNPLQVKGNIVIAGSSTVYPLTEAMAVRFRDEGYSDNITIDSIGSGAGFERFCVTGEIDIANASRPIEENETASARKIGREPIEFRVGTDALAVVVSRENTFLNELSLTELALVFGETKTWSEIDPAWPDEEILRYIPGTDSGTFDYFVEAVYAKNIKIILEAANLQLSEDDNVLVQGIEGSPYSIGFFGYAYYEENQNKLKIIDIEGITASAATVDDASYPLARPLFIYSSADILKAKPQVAAFINFYLSYVAEEIISVGYFPANESVIRQAKQKWLDAARGLY